MFYKIGRCGPSSSYPWDSTEKTEVSDDGKTWVKMRNTEGFPKELIEEAFGYRMHRGEYKEWIKEVKDMKEMNNTHSNDKLICPYCGYEEEVDFETFYSDELECDEEHDCLECGKTFIASRGAIMFYETFEEEKE